MRIDLTPADRQSLVSALEFSRRDDMNSLANRGGMTDAENTEADREEAATNRFYDRLIGKIERPQRRPRNKPVTIRNKPRSTA
jgi:hypothetical protein